MEYPMGWDNRYNRAPLVTVLLVAPRSPRPAGMLERRINVKSVPAPVASKVAPTVR